MEARRTNAWLWPVLAILIGVVVVALLLGAFMPYGGGYYGMMGYGGGWGIAMMIVPLVVLVLVVLVLAGALTPRNVPTGSGAYAPTTMPSSSAEDILNARYARGEISREEYLRIKADLSGRREG